MEVMEFAHELTGWLEGGGKKYHLSRQDEESTLGWTSVGQSVGDVGWYLSIEGSMRHWEFWALKLKSKENICLEWEFCLCNGFCLSDTGLDLLPATYNKKEQLKDCKVTLFHSKKQ